MEFPRPLDRGTDRRLSRDDIWLLGLVLGYGSALVVGCLAVTSAVRALEGDTAPIVAASVQAGTTAALLVALVCVAASRRRTGRRVRELTRTKERFLAVYGASPAGIVETDLEQRIVNCNAAFGAMLGLDAADIRGHQGWEFFHGDSPPPDVAALKDMVAGVRSTHSAARLLRSRDGSPLAVKLDWAAIHDTSGAVTQLACVVTDISEQARTAAEVVRARERAEALWRQASIGVIEGTPDGIITSVNDSFARMVGYRPEDLVGTPASALADPAYGPEISVGIERLEAGAGYVAERHYLTADGRSLPVLVSTAVLHDENGAVDRFAGFVVDVSELHAQQKALIAARDELARRQSFTDALLETVDVGILSCAADGSQLNRNRAEREMLGLKVDDPDAAFPTLRAELEVLDLDGALVAPADYPIQRALDGRGISRQELMMGPRGGPHRQVVLRTSRITSPDGTLLGAVSALTDVTAERAVATELAQESDRLAEAQRLGQLGSFTLDLLSGRFQPSEEMHRIWGLPLGADLGAVWTDIVHPDDRVSAVADWRSAVFTGGRHASAYRIIWPDGTVRHLRVGLDVQLGADGRAHRVRGTHLDVTDLEIARLEAAEAAVLVSAVLIATPDFTFVTDVTTGAVVYAPPGKDIVGVTSETLIKHGASAIAALIHPEDQGLLRSANVTADGLDDSEVLQIRYRLRDTDGSWHWLSRRVTPFRRNAEGHVVEVLGVVRDITDVVEAESRLQHSALHDPLTGLPNRALLMDRLEEALARAMQTGREAAVLFCDLDGFKRVNDTAGHAAGDAVLIETTRRISAVLREHDTVARVGGDEFVVIVEPWKREPGGTPKDEPFDDRALAVELAERLAVAIRQPVRVDAVEHVVTASIGITYAGTVAVAADDVLRDADAAMYHAKHGGKDRFEVFEHGLRTDLAERGRVEQLLRRAVSPTVVPVPRGTPTVAAAYQPVVDAATGALVGFEALARLSDGRGGNIPPDVFIPVAESTALIRPLGMLMLDRACGQLALWRRTVPGMAHVTMAVNVSALQAQHASLLDDVRGTLRAHGLTGPDLVLELTESSLLQAAHSTLTALHTLRDDGVGIAIDDFGTGYASLRYLTTLPVSAVKVDRSFTAGLPDDQTCRTIVRAVVGLATELNLTCIVEGVETEEQRSALPVGVQLQGWLTGRPALEPDVAALLAGKLGPAPWPVFMVH